MNVNQKDLGAGLSFLTVALTYGWIARRDLPVGVMLNMGPGYFPMVLCSALAAIGTYLTIRSLRAGKRTRIGGRVAWRPILAISLAIIVFGTFVNQLGLFVSVFATAFMCAMASRHVKWKSALPVAFLLAALCTVVFSYGVKLPIPVLGTWFKDAAAWIS